MGATSAESRVWDTADINSNYESDRRALWHYPGRGRRIDGDNSGTFGSDASMHGAGGAVFAAWPLLYAASFSGLYLAMFLVLGALILRPVGFMFRNKIGDPRWRNTWDWALLIGGVVPALV